MGSATLATHILLALASLSAAAHRPAPGKHHLPSSKHQPAASHLKKAASKRATKAGKHKKVVSKSHEVAKQHHIARHQVASHKHREEPAKHHLAALAQHSARHSVKGAHHQAKPQPAGRTYNVTATVYQAVPGQTDGSPFITADNSRIRPRYGSHTRWLALSPDLLKQGGGKFHYGDKVQVSRVSPQLDGVYTVHDTMNRRHRHRIDILTHRREKLSVFAPGAKLRLAEAPRKSRAPATAVAHARPGRGSHARAVSFRSRASGKRANYLASAIL
jgi:3D (Asp-Asp-Asp) domain-containing protein